MLKLLKLLIYFDLIFRYIKKGDSKSSSIIYPPRVVPKVEPNTNDAQSRNVWGQSSSAPPQQRISHPPPHCKLFFVFLFFLPLYFIFINN